MVERRVIFRGVGISGTCTFARLFCSPIVQVPEILAYPTSFNTKTFSFTISKSLWNKVTTGSSGSWLFDVDGKKVSFTIDLIKEEYDSYIHSVLVNGNYDERYSGTLRISKSEPSVTVSLSGYGDYPDVKLLRWSRDTPHQEVNF